MALDFFNRLYGTDPEKKFLKRFITLSVSRILAAIENHTATNQKSYLILSVQHFVLFRNSLFANPLSHCFLRPCGYSKFIIYPTTFNQRVLDLKAAKSQEVFSFLSHLQKKMHKITACQLFKLLNNRIACS